MSEYKLAAFDIRYIKDEPPNLDELSRLLNEKLNKEYKNYKGLLNGVSQRLADTHLHRCQDKSLNVTDTYLDEERVKFTIQAKDAKSKVTFNTIIIYMINEETTKLEVKGIYCFNTQKFNIPEAPPEPVSIDFVIQLEDVENV